MSTTEYRRLDAGKSLYPSNIFRFFAVKEVFGIHGYAN